MVLLDSSRMGEDYLIANATVSVLDFKRKIESCIRFV